MDNELRITYNKAIKAAEKGLTQARMAADMCIKEYYKVYESLPEDIKSKIAVDITLTAEQRFPSLFSDNPDTTIYNEERNAYNREVDNLLECRKEYIRKEEKLMSEFIKETRDAYGDI